MLLERMPMEMTEEGATLSMPSVHSLPRSTPLIIFSLASSEISSGYIDTSHQPAPVLSTNNKLTQKIGARKSRTTSGISSRNRMRARARQSWFAIDDGVQLGVAVLERT